MAEDEDTDFLSIPEVAAFLGVSQKTVRRRIRDRWRGFPAAIRVGPRDHRISRKQLGEWIDAQFKRATRNTEDDGC